MSPYLEHLKEFLSRLSAAQKMMLALVLVGSTAALAGIAYWANRPDYALLFGGLSATDAGKIVETLKEQNIPYELKENGASILVPRENVYDLRLRIASDGLVSDGQAGYELFDQNSLGMTDFMQKVNLRRALEGELAKTITSIRQVEQCRVHLVLPERSPFKEKQARPSASVVMQLAGGGALNPAQIEGITALVSGAVEGLAPADVTILDTRGALLSNPAAGNPDASLSSSQLRAQKEVETHLTTGGQSMLDQVLGPGNAIVRVSATLDFSRTVSEKETIDPESATVISEEQLDEQRTEGDATNSAVRNYELSRTREREEKSVGAVKAMTISVIVNHKATLPPADEPEAKPTFAPHTPAELQEIEDLVKNAVGFDSARGDRFAIHQTLFDTSANDQVAREMEEAARSERANLYVRYGAMAAAMLLALFIFLASMRWSRAPRRAGAASDGRMSELGASVVAGQLGAPQAGDGQSGRAQPEHEEMVLIEDVYTSKLSAEAKARLKAKHLMYEELKAQTEHNPAQTTDVIRSWLSEDAGAIAAAK